MDAEFKMTQFDMSEEEFSDLLCDGTYGTGIKVEIDGPEKKVRKFKKDNGTLNYVDFRAKWLYQGGKLKIDLNEFDEEDADYDDELVATFNKKDAMKRIAWGYNNGEIKEDVQNLLDGNDDAITGINILQYIGFQDLIVG